jgi:hypothetical protein
MYIYNGYDFIGVCHDNNIIYRGRGKEDIFTPKCLKKNDGKRVPLLFNHDRWSVNAVLGYAELKFSDEHNRLRAHCFLFKGPVEDMLLDKFMDVSKGFVLDIQITNLKQSSTGKWRDGIVREVSVMSPEDLPEHEPIQIVPSGVRIG